MFKLLALAGDVSGDLHCKFCCVMQAAELFCYLFLQVQCQEKTLEAHKAGHLSDGLRSVNAAALGCDFTCQPPCLLR